MNQSNNKSRRYTRLTADLAASQQRVLDLESTVQLLNAEILGLYCLNGVEKKVKLLEDTVQQLREKLHDTEISLAASQKELDKPVRRVESIVDAIIP